MSTLSDLARAYWNFDENGPSPPTSYTSADEVTTSDLSSIAEDTVNAYCSNRVIFYESGTNQMSSRASNTATQLGDFDWEICGWTRYDPNASGGGAVGALFGKISNIYPGDADYAIANSAFVAGSPATYTLNLFVRDTSGASTQLVGQAGCERGTFYFFDAYHDSVNNQIGISVTELGESSRTAFTTVSWSGGVRVTASDFRSGNRGAGGDQWCGNLSRVGLFTGLLNNSQRDYLFGLTNGGCPPDWPFDDFEGAAGWLASVMRVRNLDDFSTQTYGTERAIVFPALATSQAAIEEEALIDTDGLGANDQGYLRVRRDGDNANNADARRQTLVTVRLKVPVL